MDPNLHKSPGPPNCQSVAMFWDFENVHACEGDRIYYNGWYREYSSAIQPCLLDVATIVSWARGYGQMVINNAYGPWGPTFASYFEVLASHSIKRIDVWKHSYRAKNAADVALAADAVVNTLVDQPSIRTVIIASGDCDFIPLARILKQRGRRVVGLGVRRWTNNDLRWAVDQFISIESLEWRRSAKQLNAAIPFNPCVSSCSIADQRPIHRGKTEAA